MAKIFGKIKGSAMIFAPIAGGNVSENNALYVDSDSGTSLVSKGNDGLSSPLTTATQNNFRKLKQSGWPTQIPQNTLVSLLLSGKIVPADSDVAGGQQPIGITLSTIDPNEFKEIALLGQNMSGVVAGKGFKSGEDIYLSEDGTGYTNDPSTLTAGDDTIAVIGVADCASNTASEDAVDLIVFREIVGRPA